MIQFQGFVGNESVKERLSAAFESSKIPHAVILEGAQGCGKRTFAKLLAKVAVCKGKDRPCGECSACIRVQAGSHPDIHIESGGTAARSFHVDAIRFIRSDAYIRPNESSYKVYLLFRAETMSEQAQNALLKILEEPPARVVFILTCDSAISLLPTIRSRAQIFTLQPVSEELAEQVVSERFPDIPLEKVQSAVKAWEGNIGKAIETLQEGEFQTAVGLACQIALAVVAQQEFLILQLTSPFVKDRNLFRTVLERLHTIFRDASVLRAGGRSLSGENCAQELSMALTRERLLELLHVVEETRRFLEQNANLTLCTTVFCIKLRMAAGL